MNENKILDTLRKEKFYPINCECSVDLKSGVIYFKDSIFLIHKLRKLENILKTMFLIKEFKWNVSSNNSNIIEIKIKA